MIFFYRKITFLVSCKSKLYGNYFDTLNDILIQDSTHKLGALRSLVILDSATFCLRFPLFFPSLLRWKFSPIKDVETEKRVFYN